ncbi:hypothetical protein [Bradyrhizobium sp. CCBAU 51753]|uniref:hypothetical protein n=1 Tax=Bradyrhizobium sp. CCBAU 51753 TaxID=1325100 RepID=UPI00188B62CE|nr:hypothetical protein [Bradyrhizobium sp. CCBAU 51753]QOZ25345.1 hypothetical protein XH93_18390 [Bradyrhizobium sp. CCBAU 51753]
MNDTATIEQPAAASADNGWQWVHLEVMGHRSHWGRVREEERFGTKMLRIDVPSFENQQAYLEAVGAKERSEPILAWETHYYSGASIFSFRLTDEATVMQANKPYQSPSRLTYRASTPAEDGFGPTEDDEPHRDDDDDEGPF